MKCSHSFYSKNGEAVCSKCGENRGKVPEFQELDYNEIGEFAVRIRKLSDEEIDEVWYLCGFIISDHRSDLKALRDYDIKQIRKSVQGAYGVLEILLQETFVEDFRKNLKKVENK
ncbi:MAG: hypothetical protein JW791_04490 [Nanoarchaeota archaeon]|nr:hypothetical protein [Nanoarchaeota archaeon]